MKKYLMFIKFIILLLLVVAAILYIFIIKDTNKEGFQNEDIVNSPFFNINYKYYSLKTSEEAAKVPYNEDALILDIGGGFGEFDASKMPWDSENKELTQSEVVWGIIPGDASISLFKKILNANQMGDINSLPFREETNEYYYQDPMFQYGTDNAGLAAGLQVVNAVTQFAAPMIFGEIIGNKLEDAIRNKLNYKFNPSKYPKPEKTIDSILSKALNKLDLRRLKGIKLNGVVSNAKDGIKMFDNPLFKQGVKSVKQSKAGLGIGLQIANKLAKLKALNKSGTKVWAKFMMWLIKKLAKKGAFLVMKGILAGIVISTSLAWLPGGQIIDAVYNFIVTPILIVLSLPDGPITQALNKWADSEGMCPEGTTSLDKIIPEGAMMLIAFVPVIGDILDLYYPYLCSETATGLLVTKGPFCEPKYFYYPWLTTYFWNWPNYNASGDRPAVQGKYLRTEFMPSQPRHMGSLNKVSAPNPHDLYSGFDGAGNSVFDWSYGPYLDFNNFVRDAHTSQRYDQVDKKLVGFKPQYTRQTFFPGNYLPSGAKFFYADFSDPTMLVQMAQFYYDYSTRNPQINEDKTCTIEIISKINYVIASSMCTCDIECEMLNVTYDPKNGQKYNEYVTLYHDRRFYFGINYSNSAPNYWEDSTTPGWRTLDDKYDIAMYNLKEYLHRYDLFYPSEQIKPTLFVSAYEFLQDKEALLSNLIATSNYTQEDYNITLSNYTMASENFEELIEFITKDGVSVDTVREKLTYRVSTVVAVKDELWDLQKQFKPVANSNKHPQYTLYGCTHLNDTAGAATPPDIASFEEDYRKRVQFDVLPYLSRCKNSFIDTNQCIDLSNVQQIIEMYKEKYPNKDIKSIVDIKAQGKNACEFTWDEVTTGQNDMTRKNYKFLYQVDLSSCTFCLPNTLIAEGAPELPAVESIKMYKSLVTGSNEQLYNSEYNTRLGYRKAFFYQPTVTAGIAGSNVTFTKIENVDTIPRIDPNTYAILPELVRPKKPIRISYPTRLQSHLGTDSNDLCSNPETLQRFILDYNATNPANKILSVVKAYTVDENTCDLAVDMLFKQSSNNNTVQRRTVSFNVKPATEGFENVYTYDSINNNDALFIKPKTPYLEPPYSETGVTYGKPYLNQFNPTIQSNVIFFNNDLVTDYTKNTIGIVKNTRDLLIELKGSQYLGDDNSNCKKKCDDTEIMQRIMEQYNNDNQAKGRYGQENKTMYTIFKSATESADRCHLYFAQTTDYYGDFYAANKIDPNNYLTESKVALRAVSMKQIPGTCDFVPITGQTYLDISASDIALQAGVDVFANDSNFYTPARQNCRNLNCKDPNLINAAINNYNQLTGSSVTRVFKTLKVGNDTCDYSIVQNLLYEGQVIPDIESVLRVRYKYPIFDKYNPTNCGSFTYEPATVYDGETYMSDTFELQFAVNTTDTDPNVSPILSYMGNPNDPISSVIQNIP